MNQSAWSRSPASETEIEASNQASQETSPSYLPPPTPPNRPFEQPRPARSQAPSRWMRIPTDRPRLTMVLLVILVLAFVPMLISPDMEELFVSEGALQKGPILLGEWWRLITATFLHGNLLHIALNGYALYMIGMEVEAFYGRGRFAAIYALSGLAGSVASFIFLPRFASGVGASGAIFGLIGALAVYFGLNRGLFGKMGQAQFWNILFVIVLNMGIGFSGIFPIDNSAHIGGLIAGAAVGFVLCPRYRIGPWRNPLVREVENVNTGSLPWIATLLIGLSIVGIFLDALVYFRQ